MRLAPAISIADLGAKAAAVTGIISGRPVAVINQAALADPVIRDQAAHELQMAGFDADSIMGALLPHG